MKKFITSLIIPPIQEKNLRHKVVAFNILTITTTLILGSINAILFFISTASILFLLPFLFLLFFIVIALYLLSRGGFTNSALHLFFIIALVSLLVAPRFEYSVSISIGSIIIMLILLAISWYYGKKIEQETKGVHYFETELAKERELLQQKMTSHTRSINESEQEKLAQLYRFAEFGKLSSGLFHDLINPLTAVNLSINSLKDEHTNLPMVQETLERAVATTHQIDEMITTIKKQIQTQEIEKVFSVTEELKEVLTLLHHKAGKNNVLVNFDGDDVTVLGNPLKFQQVITNLISNAIDSYATIESETKTVRVHLQQKNKTLVIKISDQGCGIPASVIPKIFDPFFTTKPLFKGIGLGLSTTKEVTEKYFRGTVKVESQLHKGSTFTIQIPLSPRIETEKSIPQEYNQHLALE